MRRTAETTVLVTAFEPFGERRTNRSQLVLEHVSRAAGSARGIREGGRVVTRALPVSFARLEAALDKALACRPDAILLLGESAKAEELRIERVAVNRIEAKIPDNDGAQPQDERVVESGPSAYFSTLPIRPALAAVRKSGVPVVISRDAGLYACNAAYYLALHKLRATAEGKALPPIVFVHIPVKSRAMALRTATRGVLALVRHLIDVPGAKPRRPTRRTGTGRDGQRPAAKRKA